MIFLDTSAIYALADKADPNHADAYKKFDLALKSNQTYLKFPGRVILNPVLDLFQDCFRI